MSLDFPENEKFFLDPIYEVFFQYNMPDLVSKIVSIFNTAHWSISNCEETFLMIKTHEGHKKINAVKFQLSEFDTLTLIVKL